MNQLLELGVQTWLVDAVSRLARDETRSLDAHLLSVGEPLTLENTRATCRCHYVRRDGNGRPRIQQLADKLAEQAIDYCIPRTRIREAHQHFQTTGSTEQFAQLNREARALFTSLKKSGEGGELLLYLLLEVGLGLPQLLCKMDLKTNTRMHVHGADGLHAGVDDDTGKLVLYWGESKIFADASAAIRDCLGSLAPMLRDDDNGGAASDRDFQLLQRHADLDDPALEAAFKQFLDVDGEHYNSVEFRGLCLVGFDCEAYPATPGAINADAVAAQVIELLPRWKQQILRRVQAETLEGFGMHFICVPFPSAEDFRERLLQELGLAQPAAVGAAATTATTATPGAPTGPTASPSTAPADSAAAIPGQAQLSAPRGRSVARGPEARELVLPLQEPLSRRRHDARRWGAPLSRSRRVSRNLGGLSRWRRPRALARSLP